MILAEGNKRTGLRFLSNEGGTVECGLNSSSLFISQVKRLEREQSFGSLKESKVMLANG